MEISKFALYHGYFSSVSLRLQMVYPNTWILWFSGQLDLELMFSSIISLRTANWYKRTKLFTDLLTLSIDAICLLALFIRCGGFTYWIYLLALFIGFLYSLALFIRFGGFIYLVYLLTLVLVYTVSIPTAFSFSHSSVRNTLTILSLDISHVLMEKIFRFPLRHHSFLIKLTLLQLHHRTSLIKLMNITSLHYHGYM